VELTGSEGTTGKMVLSEDGFHIGSTKKINLYSNDIGDIMSMRLSSLYVEQWRPDKIVISKSGKSHDEFLPKGEKLSCPSKCSMNLAVLPPDPGSGGANDQVDMNDEEAD
jgi:hypothetical protein